MTSTQGFLAMLRRLDVRVWVDQDRLRCNAPEGTLTPALQKELSRRKDDILSVLREQSAAVAPTEPTIRSIDRHRHIPPSFGQQRLWFIELMAPGVAVYNLSMASCFKGDLDTSALSRSLAEIVRRHEILRTTFTLVDGQMAQVIDLPYGPCGAVEEIVGVTASDRDASLRQVVREERERKFNLEREPPLRARLVRMGDRDHVLILTVHHSATDGLSIRILHRELAVLYRAYRDGGPSPLPPLPIQYSEYACWQREVMSGDVLNTHLQYWRAQLEEAPAVLELPAYRPRPVVQTFNGASTTFQCPKSVVDALRKIAQREHVTLFMTLLAAWTVLLQRYTGQNDIVVGSPIGGRTRRELEDLIGFFVNSLVLRIDLSGDPTFAQVLGRVKAVTLDAYAHQDVPFEKLVEVLRPQRDLSRSPLFQIEFVLQDDRAGSATEFAGLRVSPLAEPPTLTAKLDLSVELTPGPEGISGVCVHNTDVLDDETVVRLARHFVSLLESIAGGVDQRIADLVALPQGERDRLLRGGLGPVVDLEAGVSVHDLVARQAARTPDAVAVRCQGESCTYAELNAKANQLAHYLRARGVGPDALVGLSVERSIEMVVGLLGILKAGGAYVPLDPSYPGDRLAFMLEDAGVSILLTQERLLDSLPNGERKLVCLDRDWPRIAQESSSNPEAPGGDHLLAYVIYTSGSTGRPKGVQIPHHAVVNFLAAMAREPGLGPADVLVSVTTLSFDISGLELHLPLTVGACVVVATREDATDGRLLRGLLESEHATVMQATPATWRLLIESGWTGSDLKMLCGGEAMPQELASQLLERGAELWNLYGPTETTIWSTLERVTPGGVTIGRPIANTQTYVLDRHLQPVPVGVPGELYIGGDGLARGYRNGFDLTAVRFVPDPFGASGGRMYRTGDLARYLPDGRLECLGRLDHQVKVRGFRVELGEVESALAAHPGTSQAIVMVREDVPGDRRLVAYVVGEGDRTQLVSALRALVVSKLPQYMHPAAYVVLDKVPLLPNGKVDRNALPLPEGRREFERVAVAPRTDLEREIARVWQEVLRVSDIGIHDNFFELGGHSLLVMQLTSRLHSVVGTEVRLTSVFQAPTIAEMGDLVLQQLLEAQGAEAAEALLAEVLEGGPEEVRAAPKPL